MTKTNSSWRGLVAAALGPVLGLVAWCFAAELPTDARALAFILAWVVTWWILEPAPLAVTGVLGCALCALLGVAPAKEAFSGFGDPIVFLFLGGFLLAKSLEVHGSDQRIALRLVSLPWVRQRPERGMLALVLITGLLSMWLSNTATTVIMIPVALGILMRVVPHRKDLFPPALLSIAYAASIGGLGTPVGSPPNVIAIASLERLIDRKIGFVEWMSYGVPVAFVLLGALMWTFRGLWRELAQRPAGTHSLLEEWQSLGPPSYAQKVTLAALGATIVLWVVPDLLVLITDRSVPALVALKSHLPEVVPPLLTSALLFLIPVEGGRKALTWSEATQIDWGTLLLFGSGLTLGSLMFKTGLAEAVGGLLPDPAASGWLAWASLGGVLLFSLFFTEVTSNTATANMLVPLVIASVQGAGLDPTQAVIGVGLACSLAFMLPVATPPNAIVYGTGWIPIQVMVRKGLVLNLVSLVIILVYLKLRG